MPEWFLCSLQQMLQMISFWPKGITKPTQDSPCVLVKNGPGTEMNPIAFSIKKLIFRW